MNRRKSLYSFVISILVMALLTTACSTGNKADTSAKIKTITMPWRTDIGPLNPHLYDPNQMFAQAMVYESLVNYSNGGQIVPGLAERWTVSDDGMIYTFFLRKNVKYSDGSVFDADNVKRNIDAVMANKQRHTWMGIVGALESVEKVDDYTVRLKLNKFYYPVLQELAFVRPFRFLGNTGFPDNGQTSTAIKAPVGTGPWVLKEYKKDDYALFARNENYWGVKPKLDQIKVKIMPDSESILLAFEKKEIDFIYGRGVISLDSFKHLKESGKYGISQSDPLTTRLVVLNTQKGPTADLNVRKAIEYGIDKKKMVESVAYGTELMADTILAKEIPYADVGLTPIGYNPDKAKQLLEEAGWKLPAGKTVREKNGQPLTVKFTYIATEAVQKAIAEIMQGELAKIGIRADIQGVDVMVGLQQLKNGESNMNFWSSLGPPNDPHNFAIISSQPGSTGVYEAQSGLPNKKEIDDKIRKVLASHDENERKGLYKSILTSFHEQVAFYPISYETFIAVYQKNVSGIVPKASKYDFPFSTLEVSP
ncbi:nickel ABC transporter substrate-binding protein [Paenibacillus sedimenti]|uniref:Nickel ABC transporter, nickel/metallophore periplasmic binding protein n=1 Tax=Paenibacillus sedimenti TaxID=2770274 RepID=A0A926KVD6_9BACL|nr:nickel ABC transporter substrate-binding protein [Paenibacillus sedimenti]MBD0384232.1 nickel ABC transporter, nickel/metallophore periplasmic binding protein [Paenibacillus sedimenti]